ncbi:hypothetical protein E2562_023528 [Oryza meyeriana var. granulata]|uniref:Uncharacterized protein n=1 Tax=Oryza meyeriana var. granulata TaxID=110450 RepID=A0A6G1E1D2_9ORYZ|nr:hypothetical protein E2562_023528 [Oryza meyeriana var. granulata]
METASSSADPGPPLWNLEGRPLKFVFHGVSYTAHVQDVARSKESSASVVKIRVSGAPRRLPFPGGERALLITDEANQVDSIRAACLDIITRSKRAVEFVLVDVIGSVFPSVCGASVPLLASSVEAALCILMYVGMRKIFPEWDGTPTSILFHVEGIATDMFAVDLTTSLDNKAIQLENDDASSNPESAERLTAILSFCVDVIRYVPIGGCLLELS